MGQYDQAALSRLSYLRHGRSRTVQQYLLHMDDFARVLSQDGQFVPLAKEETQLIGSFTNRGDRVVPMSEALKDGDQVVVMAAG